MAEKIHRSKISNTEWGFVIFVLLIVDAVQLLLNLIAVGIAVNRVISFIVGITLPFYLHIRGEKMADFRRLLGVLGAFGLEFIPGVDFLPLWTADGIYNMVLAKRRDKLAAKQEIEVAGEERKKKIDMQNERAARIQEMRQRQEEQRREEQRLAAQRETEQNALDENDEDLYDKAA